VAPPHNSKSTAQLEKDSVPKDRDFEWEGEREGETLADCAVMWDYFICWQTRFKISIIVYYYVQLYKQNHGQIEQETNIKKSIQIQV